MLPRSGDPAAEPLPLVSNRNDNFLFNSTLRHSTESARDEPEGHDAISLLDRVSGGGNICELFVWSRQRFHPSFAWMSHFEKRALRIHALAPPLHRSHSSPHTECDTWKAHQMDEHTHVTAQAESPQFHAEGIVLQTDS